MKDNDLYFLFCKFCAIVYVCSFSGIFNPIVKVYKLVCMVHSLHIFLDELGPHIFNTLCKYFIGNTNN